MIPSFPAPYPDELLYSVIARYGHRTGYNSRKRLIQVVFGRSTLVPSIEFPSFLQGFINQLPSGHPCKSESSVIERCTLLPWYSPFLPPERVEAVKTALLANGARGIYMSLGIMASRVTPPSRIRYCPECFREDIAFHGELFWRRLHQMRGIEVCPKHNVFLENSNLPRGFVVLRQSFEVPAPDLAEVVSRPLSLGSQEQQGLLRLAQRGLELLTTSWPSLGLHELQTRYVEALRNKGFVTPAGNVRLADIAEQMSARYSNRFLGALRCVLDCDLRASWIGRLLHRSSGAQAPIRHLLMLDFLELKLADLFQDRVQPDAQVLQGPQKCPNPLCDANGAHSARMLRREYSRKLRAYVQVLECFSCNCIFSRPENANALPAKCRIRDYGPGWKSKLRQMWEDPCTSLRQMARTLKVHRLTIKREALKCALRFPRRARWRTGSSGLAIRAAKTRATKISRLRQRWLTVRQVQPDVGVNAIRKVHSALYSALYRLDYEWLMAHRPTRRRSGGPRGCDWETRDVEASAKLLQLLAEIGRVPLLPIRLTRTRLASAIGAKIWIQKHPERMPILRSLLVDLTECSVRAACRRIRHVQVVFANRRIRLSLPQLKRLAGIRAGFDENPVVARRLEDAFNSLGREVLGKIKSGSLFQELRRDFDN
jgi:hypothetical protein